MNFGLQPCETFLRCSLPADINASNFDSLTPCPECGAGGVVGGALVKEPSVASPLFVTHQMPEELISEQVLYQCVRKPRTRSGVVIAFAAVPVFSLVKRVNWSGLTIDQPIFCRAFRPTATAGHQSGNGTAR